jgi:hypothetical protein
MGACQVSVVIGDPECQQRPAVLELGQCGCWGPKTVDRLLGRREALGVPRVQGTQGAGVRDRTRSALASRAWRCGSRYIRQSGRRGLARCVDLGGWGLRCPDLPDSDPTKIWVV